MFALVKKLLVFLAFSLLASANVFAEDFKIMKFNQWLLKNGYLEYLNLEENKLCKEEPKYSQIWFINNCDKFQGSNNLNIKIKNIISTYLNSFIITYFPVYQLR